MAQVIWTEAAQEDVRQIQSYIAQDSRTAASAMVRRIRVASRRLAQYPESGRMIPEYGDPEYREIIVGSYRLLYRYLHAHGLVRVLAVIHGSRSLPPVRQIQ